MKDKIVITNWEMSDKYAFDKNLFKDDTELEAAIVKFKDNLPSDIEVFKHEKNVIITENKCYGAFYESDLGKI
jgi:hypothetical protein